MYIRMLEWMTASFREQFPAETKAMTSCVWGCCGDSQRNSVERLGMFHLKHSPGFFYHTLALIVPEMEVDGDFGLCVLAVNGKETPGNRKLQAKSQKSVISK